MIPDALRRLVVARGSDRNEGRVLSISEAAELLNVTRVTVQALIDSKCLLALRGALIPVEQIIGAGEVVPGIAEVLEVIPDPEAAWDFLSEVSAFIDPGKSVRPIDALRESKVEGVVGAAHSFLEAFS